MKSKGMWWLMSASDSRWDCQGEGMVGGFDMPRQARLLIKIIERIAGKYPEDLEYGYIKY